MQSIQTWCTFVNPSSRPDRWLAGAPSPTPLISLRKQVERGWSLRADANECLTKDFPCTTQVSSQCFALRFHGGVSKLTLWHALVQIRRHPTDKPGLAASRRRGGSALLMNLLAVQLGDASWWRLARNRSQPAAGIIDPRKIRI